MRCMSIACSQSQSYFIIASIRSTEAAKFVWTSPMTAISSFLFISLAFFPPTDLKAAPTGLSTFSTSTTLPSASRVVLFSRKWYTEIFKRFTDITSWIADDRVEMTRHRFTLTELQHGWKVSFIIGRVSILRQWRNSARNAVKFQAAHFIFCHALRHASDGLPSHWRLSLLPPLLSVLQASLGRVKFSINRTLLIRPFDPCQN